MKNKELNAYLKLLSESIDALNRTLANVENELRRLANKR